MKALSRYLALAVLFSMSVPWLCQGGPTVGGNNPTGVVGDYNGSITTAGSYDPLTGNAKRMIDDLTVTGSVGAYPLKFTRILNSRGGMGTLGQGGGWRHNYQWALSALYTPHPNPPACFEPPPDIRLSYPDGGKRGLRFENGTFEQMEGWPMGDRLVTRLDLGSNNYDLNLKDGGKVEFRNGANGSHPPTAIVDPFGLRTTLEYDALNRLSIIREPAGRFLQISYSSLCYTPAIPEAVPVCIEFINQVAAHDGRGNMMEKVIYTYTWADGAQEFGIKYLNLTRTHYDDGQAPHANYSYWDPQEVTPGSYWTMVPGRVKTCDDVRYEGPMKRIMYQYVPAANSQACPVASGQVLAEKNMTTGEALSSVEYPVGGVCTVGELPFFERTERRADNATRVIQYDRDGELLHYTDFAKLGQGELHHKTIISYTQPAPGSNGSHYLRTVKDARNNATSTEKEYNIDAVMAVIHPNLSKRTYRYTDPNNPYYLAESTDENGKTTYYDRYGVPGFPPADEYLKNKNRIWRIRYPDGGEELFTYNRWGQVLWHRMTSGGEENFSYNDTWALKETYTPPITPSDETPTLNPTRYFYYTSGPHVDRLEHVQDPRGNSTWYEYNARGQVTKVRHQDNTFTESLYYPDGTLERSIDELVHITRFEYDEYKRVTKAIKIVDNFEEVTQNDYTPLTGGLGPLSHTSSTPYYVTSPMLRRTQFDYDSNFRRKRMTVAFGTNDAATTNYVRYDAVGNLERVQDPRNKFTTYGYDDRNRQTSVWNEELNEATAVVFDDAGNKKGEAREGGAFRSWDYDEMNRLWKAYDWRMNVAPEPHQTTTYDRDEAGNVRFITDTKGAVYSFLYDKLNRKESATNPSDNTVPPRTETWLYDKAGNLLRYRNPAGQYQHFVHDNRNRQRRSYWNLVSEVNFDTEPNWSIGQEITTTPDAASRITEIKTNGGETIVAFGYDHANRKIWEDQTIAGQPTRRVKTDLDHDGKRINLQIIDPPAGGGGFIISEEMEGTGYYSIAYDYTNRNQLFRIRGTGQEDWIFTYTYDPSGNMISRRADYNNGKTNITSCPETYYDALNRPTRWEQTGPNGFSALSHYRYDRVNREEATWRAENNNRGESFEYEITNQLRKVSYNVAGSATPAPPTPTPPSGTPTPPPSGTPTPPPSGTPTPPPSGTPTPPPSGTPTPPPGATPTPSQQVAMPTFNPYDPDGYNYFPYTSISVTITTTTIGAQIRWTNDGTDPTPNHGTLISASSGTMTSGEDFTLRAIAFKSGMADSAVMEGGYNRDSGDAPAANGRTVTFTHTLDKLNRSSMNDNGVVTNYSPNMLNQYTSTAGNSFSYDNNFNLTHTVGFYGAYNAANRLILASNVGSGEVQETIVGFVYDGLGRCVKRTFNGVATILVYDGWKPIGEFDEFSYFQAWNVYGAGADEILLRQKDKMGYTRFLLDRHGNVNFLVDNDGVVREKCTFDVFGHPTVTDGDGANPRSWSYFEHCFLFQGREYIRELGIYDYRNRFYHPKLGRFIQTDPKGLDGGDMNVFRYCSGDPVNLGDPMGLYAIKGEVSSEQKKLLEEAQKTMADKLDAGANKIDSALKAGEESTEYKKVKKDFEGVMGKPVTAKDMTGYAERARRMVEGLRDDGKKGYVMIVKDQAYFASKGLPDHPAAGVWGRKTMFINKDLAFKPEKELGYSLPWIVGHEAAHNQWVSGDIYRHQPAYKTMTPQEALDNADKHIEFVY